MTRKKITTPQTVGDLKNAPYNPRKITDEKAEFLKRSLKQFGDISGVWHNVRTGNVGGGNMRTKAFPPDAKIHIEHRYRKPTGQGTLAYGYIEYNGERYSYREVDWTIEVEKTANLAANQQGGQWDMPLLADRLLELDQVNVDLDLTGFDEKELQRIMAPKTRDKKPRVCPRCGHEF